MAFTDLLVTEIFHSLQGESSLAGLRFAFVRLSGCNLRCAYCDSTYAFKGGTKMTIDDVLKTVAPYQVQHVLVTGGEPLLQRGTVPLIRALRENYQVSVETHGEVSIEPVAGLAKVIMDIKTPGSGMCRERFRENLRFLREDDEVKFVISSIADYTWARDLVRTLSLPVKEILFSPVLPSASAPGSVEGVRPTWLAEQILQDKLDVRMQLQLHKFIWSPDQRGV